MSIARELPKFSLKKLKEHDSNNKDGIHLFGLWGRVYDATTFPHPAGSAPLMQHCGSVINHVFEPGGRHQAVSRASILKRLSRVIPVGELDEKAPDEVAERSSVAKL